MVVLKMSSSLTKAHRAQHENIRGEESLAGTMRARNSSQREGRIHRVYPDFGSTLTVSDRDSQPNCWVSWKIMGQPCGSQAARPA
jgi:hypothetical protein